MTTSPFPPGPVRQFFALPLPLVLAVALASGVAAHPGTVDTQGGHVDRTRNSYHCHAEPCLGQHRQSAASLREAQEQGRAVSLLYRRKDWQHWSDADGNCQDTRAEVLIKSSLAPVRHYRNNRCYSVIRGQWFDPYTGRPFTDARQLDIDHRIALAEAHRYGGAGWSKQQKETFANDPLNLVPVERAVNRVKSDLPAYQWMPRNIAYWCEYIRNREAVAEKYSLTFPPGEQSFNAMVKQQHCKASKTATTLKKR